MMDRGITELDQRRRRCRDELGGVLRSVDRRVGHELRDMRSRHGVEALRRTVGGDSGDRCDLLSDVGTGGDRADQRPAALVLLRRMQNLGMGCEVRGSDLTVVVALSVLRFVPGLGFGDLDLLHNLRRRRRLIRLRPTTLLRRQHVERRHSPGRLRRTSRLRLSGRLDLRRLHGLREHPRRLRSQRSLPLRRTDLLRLRRTARAAATDRAFHRPLNASPTACPVLEIA
jgi:hypothetical protein